MKRILCALLIAIPAFAAEESGGGAEEPSLLIWKVLNFLILAGLIGWLIAKHGGPLIASRAKTISEGLAAGTRAKAEADARAAEVQKKLGNLEQEISALRTTAQEERAREADRIRRETQAEIVRIQYQANVEIESPRRKFWRACRRMCNRLSCKASSKTLPAAPRDRSRRTNSHDLFRRSQQVRERPCGCSALARFRRSAPAGH
jgi:F0F1-type ATP synthase membrane subunit b/b'